MRTIRVEVPGAAYDVYSRYNSLASLQKYISEAFSAKKVLFVIDENVMRLHREYLLETIDVLSAENHLVIEISEKKKSIDTVELIYEKLISVNAGRDAVLVGIGGGITGDITGFAAATFMRGISYIQVPTTLLSIVDSSVGGKTGVNFGSIKNIVGAFYQPEAVFADFKFLSTLEEDELVCGLGEIVKYAFLTGDEYYSKLKNDYRALLQLNDTVLDYFIAESVRYKADVVARDEKETGLRKVLNLGHTFAHGLETSLNFEIKHGQAVIAGISCALELSRLLNLISEEEYTSSTDFIKEFASLIHFRQPDLNIMLNVMSRDKKNRNGKIKFVLPVSPGEVVLDVEAEKNNVIEAIFRGIEPFVYEK